MNNRRIRVLVVDDSVVYRKIISKTIQQDHQIEVIGTAPNGKIAVDMIKKSKPDVVTLDLEMPEMDGLQTLDYLKKNNIRVGVIVFSSHSQTGAKMTFDAIEKGAFDFVPKPSNSDFSKSVTQISSSLIPKIKLCYARNSSLSRNGYRGGSKYIKPMAISLRRNKKRAVAIGVSTGGPNALKEVIPKLDSKVSVPIFIVQHMPPLFTQQLAERLDKISALKVKEAKNREPVNGGIVYIAPGDYHMEIIGKGDVATVKLHKGPPENNCRPAVDVLFRSVAKVYDGELLAVVLTGMGKDGLQGARVLKQKGAHIIAQDEKTSVVWGMPKAIVENGLADDILPIHEIPAAISNLVKKI